MADRGTGLTSQQMLAAQPGALFIWCNQCLDYPRDLAAKHNRRDLRIISPRQLGDHNLRGLELTGIVVDHAAIESMTDKEWRELHYLQAMVRVRK